MQGHPLFIHLAMAVLAVDYGSVVTDLTFA